MIYAYDLALQMPTKDLYDTQMMLASILAAKDLYNDRLKQLEDFNKLYDDFYSPIAEDNADYDKFTSGRVRDALNYMYQNGIDPLRSAEGGALLSRIINTTPTREINAIKQNAAIKTAYDKAVADAKKAGTYNEEFEQQLLKNAGLLNFRTINPDGSINTWGRNAPGVFKTLHDFAEPEYNKFDATEYIGQSRPGYNLYGVSKANQDLASEAALNQLKTNPELYSYYANKAQDYKTEDESTDDALRRMINQDAQHWLQPKEEIDPYYKMQKEADIDVNSYGRKQAIQDKYDEMKFKREHPEYYDADGNYIGNIIANGNALAGNGGSKSTENEKDLRASHLFSLAADAHNLQYPFDQIDPINHPEEAKKQVAAWADKIEKDQKTFMENAYNQLKQQSDGTVSATQLAKTYLSKLESPFDPLEAAELLGLKDAGVDGYYVLTEADLDRIHAISTAMTNTAGQKHLKSSSDDTTSERIRNSLQMDTRKGNYFILPMGKAVTVMDKDGVLRNYIRCNLYRRTKDSIEYENPKEVLIDLGSYSYSLTKDNRGLFAIDESKSRWGDKQYNPASKRMKSTEE